MPLKDTATETGRNEIEIETETHVPEAATLRAGPTIEWIEEYRKQATPKLIAGLNNFARTRALMVASTGRKVDDYYARSLVLDALGDTWLGIVRWDPSKCSLAYHIVRTIEGRADKHRKHAVEFPHDALGDETDASRCAERDASELIGDRERSVNNVFASESMSQIRARAARDKPILRMLAAYDAGCETKEEVLAFAKMKSRTYHNAYVRLRRMVRQLADQRLASKARA